MLKESHPTRDLSDFIKTIIETKSKEEEDRLISVNLENLKSDLTQKNLSNPKLIECAIRAMYCSMLGQEATFAQPFAVKLIESKSLYVKKVGYLACSLMLEGDSGLKILLVASLQRDLRSQNLLEVLSALSALLHLVNDSFAGVLAEAVVPLLDHRSPLVRKKALSAAHRIEQLSPGSVAYFSDKAIKGLSDSDPSVVAAALNVVLSETAKNRTTFIGQLRNLTGLQKQILEKRLNYYDYQKIPEPYMQIGVLRIIGLMCRNDKKLSEEVYATLEKTLSRADNLGTDVSHSVVYEAVLAACKVFPHGPLLDAASLAIAKFLSNSGSQNTVYLGINALRALTEVESKYIQDHHLFVVNCLESKDDSIRRITLDLLYNNTNAHNIDLISGKFFQSIESATDSGFKAELSSRLYDLALRYAPSPRWFVDKLRLLLRSAAEFFDDAMVAGTLRVLEENCREAPADTKYLVEQLLQLCAENSAPGDATLRIASHVFMTVGLDFLGEDPRILAEMQEFLRQACRLSPKLPMTRLWLVSALGEFLARGKLHATRQELREFIAETGEMDCEELVLKQLEITAGLPREDIDPFSVDFDPEMSFVFPFLESHKGKIYNPELSERYSGVRLQAKAPVQPLKLHHHVVARRPDEIPNPVETELKIPAPNNSVWTSSGYAQNLKPSKPQMNIFQNMDTRPRNTEEPKKKPESRVLEVSEEERKKKKLADELFGQKPEHKNVFEISATTKPKPQKSEPLDLFGDAAQVSAKTDKPPALPAQSKKSNADDFDLFGDFQAPASKPKPAAPADDFDLFGDPTPQASAQAPEPLIPWNLSEAQFEESFEDFGHVLEGSKNPKRVKSKSQLSKEIEASGFKLVAIKGNDFIFSGKLGPRKVMGYIGFEDGAIEYILKAEQKKDLPRLEEFLAKM